MPRVRARRISSVMRVLVVSLLYLENVEEHNVSPGRDEGNEGGEGDVEFRLRLCWEKKQNTEGGLPGNVMSLVQILPHSPIGLRTTLLIARVVPLFCKLHKMSAHNFSRPVTRTITRTPTLCINTANHSVHSTWFLSLFRDLDSLTLSYPAGRCW